LDQNYIDIIAMEKATKRSQNRETYQLIEKNQDYRVGVGARATSCPRCSFFVEVIILNSSLPNEGLDMDRLEKVFNCLRILNLKGYLITDEDRGCFASEKTVDPKRLNNECCEVQNILKIALR
jgi:hypothetical protein